MDFSPITPDLFIGTTPSADDYPRLRDLGVRRMRLMTNNPSKYVALQGYGLEIVERVPLELPPEKDNRAYLRTKKLKMGHLLERV